MVTSRGAHAFPGWRLLVAAALAAATLATAPAPALAQRAGRAEAQSARTRATSASRTAARNRRSQRVTRTERELDWIEHQHPEAGRATTIEDRRVSPDTILRRVRVDEAIDASRPSRIAGGRFRQRLLERQVRVKKGVRPWTDAEARHLVSREPQGVRYDHTRGRAEVSFFQPTAERVRLVIEGEPHPFDLDPVASGLWKVDLGMAPRSLYGREYHFEVTRKGGAVERLADPLADFTDRENDHLVSRFANLEHTWHDQGFKPPPLDQLVIYETHLPSLTRHPSSGVPENERGTYRGARSKRVLDHLSKLGVAAEFLPLHAADGLLGGDWGYYTTSYKALNQRFTGKGREREVNRDVMDLIDEYHQRGIPVIFDVVYNHGGELHVKALGKDVVYRKTGGSGVGNDIRSENPVVRQMIIETLEHLVSTYHVDGFRFDLGALLDKKTIRDIDKSLPSHIHLFAEPWAISDTKWGKDDLKTTFADTRWAVWNDDFREPVREFITGKINKPAVRDRLKNAIRGDFGWNVRPQQAVNYFAVHDGPTSADVVGGDRGRVFQGVVLTLFSQGVPMIHEGTEVMYSKGGEDNSWNRPDVNQIDWSKKGTASDMTEPIAELIALRKELPQLHSDKPLVEGKDITFINPTGYPHNDNVNAIGFMLKARPGSRPPRGLGEVIVLSNGSHQGTDFQVPPGRWKVIADGVEMKVNRSGLPGREVADEHYFLHAGATAILARDP